MKPEDYSRRQMDLPEGGQHRDVQLGASTTARLQRGPWRAVRACRWSTNAAAEERAIREGDANLDPDATFHDDVGRSLPRRNASITASGRGSVRAKRAEQVSQFLLGKRVKRATLE